jgi:CheY-like chemotaxis protein
MGRAYRVLIVEDEAAIALDIGSSLRASNFAIVGPAYSLSDALELLQRGGIDAAVLDVKLGDEDSIQVADALRQLGIPYIFVSGYAQEGLPPGHRQQPFLPKPYAEAGLLEAIEALLR